MERPADSLSASALRPWLWERFLALLEGNNVSYEVIFVGDRPPSGSLPDNVTYIQSSVKPAQCSEIASRRARGETILHFSDDCVFSKKALDVLYSRVMSEPTLTIVFPRYLLMKFCDERATGKGFRVVHEQMYGPDDQKNFLNDPNCPLMAVCGCMRKSLWDWLGGIDARFVAALWDVDVAMRLYQLGGKVVIDDYAVLTEICFEAGADASRLFNEYGFTHDAKVLDSLWLRPTAELDLIEEGQRWSVSHEHGVLMRERLEPMVSFSEEALVEKTQGNKGRWS
jgi:hypothetical protein